MSETTIRQVMADIAQSVDTLRESLKEEDSAIGVMQQRVENAKTKAALMGQAVELAIPQEVFLVAFRRANRERAALCEAVSALCDVLGSVVISIADESPIDLETLDGKTVRIPEGAKLSLVKPGEAADEGSTFRTEPSGRPCTSMCVHWSSVDSRKWSCLKGAVTGIMPLSTKPDNCDKFESREHHSTLQREDLPIIDPKRAAEYAAKGGDNGDSA